MRLPTVLSAFALVAAFATPALAASTVTAETVDPRYPFTLDLTGNFGIGTSFASFGTSQFTLGSSLAFGFPVSERRQVVIAAFAGTGSSHTGEVDYAGGAAGYRLMTFADPWRIRFDAQLAGDYLWATTSGGTRQAAKHTRGPGLGGRLAFAVHYHFFGPIFGVGLQASLSAFAITPHVVFDGGPVLTLNW